VLKRKARKEGRREEERDWWGGDSFTYIRVFLSIKERLGMTKYEVHVKPSAVQTNG
jgi:hypothetical protein